MYEQAQKSNAVKELTSSYVKWEKPGQTVLGVMIGKSEVDSSLGGGKYNQYLFETDDGMVKFALGRAGDGEIGLRMQEGFIYRIEYLGKEEISGGRRVNQFRCEEIGWHDDATAEPEKEKESGEKVNKE